MNLHQEVNLIIEIIKLWAPFAILVAILAGFIVYIVKKCKMTPISPSQFVGPPDTVTIVRNKNYTAILRQFIVLIDGVKAGCIGPGEVKHFPLTPGMHMVAVKIDWCASHPLTIGKQFNNNIILRCGIKHDNWRCLITPFFRPREYVYVYISKFNNICSIDRG